MCCLLSWCYCPAQKYLVLDVQKLNGFKRIRFSPGDEFYFRLKNDRKKRGGIISGMGDSLVIFQNSTSVNINDISRVYRNKSNFVTRKLYKFCLVMGVGFVSLDSFNNAINGETPIVKKQALLESAGFTAAGLLLKMLPVKRYHIGKRRSLKIIDISP